MKDEPVGAPTKNSKMEIWNHGQCNNNRDLLLSWLIERGIMLLDVVLRFALEWWRPNILTNGEFWHRVNISALSSVGGTKLQDTGYLSPALAAMWASYVEYCCYSYCFILRLPVYAYKREKEKNNKEDHSRLHGRKWRWWTLEYLPP